MNRTGYQFLAGPGLSLNQNGGGVCFTDLLDEITNDLDLRAFTNNGRKTVLLSGLRTHPVQPFPIPVLLLPQRMKPKGSLKCSIERLDIQRFGEEVECTFPNRAHRSCNISKCGNHNHFGRR